MPRMTERWLPDTSVLLARARKEPVKDMGLEGNKCCPYTTTLRYGVEIYEDDMDIDLILKLVIVGYTALGFLICMGMFVLIALGGL